MSLESKRQQLADFNLKASSDNDAKKRLTALFDPDTFVEMDAFALTAAQQLGPLHHIGDVLPVKGLEDDVVGLHLQRLIDEVIFEHTVVETFAVHRPEVIKIHIVGAELF